MRTRVKDILNPLASGADASKILAEYSYLEARDTQAALAGADMERGELLVELI